MYRSILAYLLAVLSCCFCQEKNFPAVVHDVCPSAKERAVIREQITEQVLSLLNSSSSESQPPCACGGPEWTRIAHLNMNDPSQQCPSDWNLISTPIRGCGRAGVGVCVSALFASSGMSYSRVCGRVIAYQEGAPDAFNTGTSNLEGGYVEGVSLTHGAAGSRQHIWTFAAALYEGASSRSTCPCTNADEPWPYEVPEFVGDDYFCDTGNPGPGVSSTVYVDDPLWDGEGCGPTSTCCEFNNPPWFCTTLPQPTTDDIELRICLTSAVFYEENVIAVE